MQNSLDRLLSGVAQVLAETVAPATADPYARAQALAASELLENLRPRVTWEPGFALGWTARARELFAEAREALPGDSELVPLDVALGTPAPGATAPAIEEYARLHTEALVDLQRRLAAAPEGVAPRLADDVRALVSARLDDELTRLRRGPAA
jgi:hypothetical protein